MRTSSLKNKVIFQANTPVKGTFGGFTDAWSDFTTQWVQIIPLKGDEKYESKHLKTEVNHKIRMRYMDGINSKMQIIYGTRVFKIDSVINPFERNRTLEIMATEVFNV